MTTTVNIVSSGGTATSSVDYQALNTTVSFLSGETSKLIQINTVEDTTIEADETFGIYLSNGSGATPSPVALTATIFNDDYAPVVKDIRDETMYKNTTMIIPYWAIDKDTQLSCTEDITVTSSNQTLLPNASIVTGTKLVTQRAGQTYTGSQLSAASTGYGISANGRYILYNSVDTNIVSYTVHSSIPLYRYDRYMDTAQYANVSGACNDLY